MKRLVLGVQYDGHPWLGWQSQPHGLTIQDKLQHALQQIAAHPVHVFCAGRTDAGVHAMEQVAHFDTEVERPLFSWVRGVNAHLPKSIAVRWAAVLPIADEHNENFHARYCAKARTYHYVLYNHPVRSPLLAGKVGWVFRPLDIERIKKGASYLIGEHDFSAFRAMECQAKSPVKDMYDITIQQRGHLIITTLRASAFLHHMVRNIIGSLIVVGTGNREPVWIEELLKARNRALAAPTFVPDGLYLAKVDYDDKWGLPQEAGVLDWGGIAT